MPQFSSTQQTLKLSSPKCLHFHLNLSQLASTFLVLRRLSRGEFFLFSLVLWLRKCCCETSVLSCCRDTMRNLESSQSEMNGFMNLKSMSGVKVFLYRASENANRNVNFGSCLLKAIPIPFANNSQNSPNIYSDRHHRIFELKGTSIRANQAFDESFTIRINGSSVLLLDESVTCCQYGATYIIEKADEGFSSLSNCLCTPRYIFERKKLVYDHFIGFEVFGTGA